MSHITPAQANEKNSLAEDSLTHELHDCRTINAAVHQQEDARAVD